MLSQHRDSRCSGLTSRSGKRLHANVLVINRASRIVPLQRKRTAAEFPEWEVLPVGGIDQAQPISRFGPLDGGLAVDLDRYFLALYDDVFGEPLAVAGRHLSGVGNGVEAAGLAVIFVVGVVDLDFEPFVGPTRLLVPELCTAGAPGEG